MGQRTFGLSLLSGIPGADDDGLKDTQGTSSAQGHTSGHAVNIDKFPSKIMWKMFQSISCCALWNAYTKNDQRLATFR